jgi:hypothetical protein
MQFLNPNCKNNSLILYRRIIIHSWNHLTSKITSTSFLKISMTYLFAIMKYSIRLTTYNQPIYINRDPDPIYYKLL